MTLNIIKRIVQNSIYIAQFIISCSTEEINSSLELIVIESLPNFPFFMNCPFKGQYVFVYIVFNNHYILTLPFKPCRCGHFRI